VPGGSAAWWTVSAVRSHIDAACSSYGCATRNVGFRGALDLCMDRSQPECVASCWQPCRHSKAYGHVVRRYALKGTAYSQALPGDQVPLACMFTPEQHTRQNNAVGILISCAIAQQEPHAVQSWCRAIATRTRPLLLDTAVAPLRPSLERPACLASIKMPVCLQHTGILVQDKTSKYLQHTLYSTVMTAAAW
jgi:hypothetical protein